MKTINATEFKAKCLDILDHIPPEGLTITKRGKEVARLVPTGVDNSRFFGSIPGLRVDPDDDLLSTGIKWDAES